MFGQARSVFGSRPLSAGRTGTVKPEQHTGDGGVHAGGVHQRPGGKGQRQQQIPVADPALHQQREQRQRQQRQQQPLQVQVLGVEQRDHGDRQQVVDHGQGQQEGAQRGRQVGGDDGENGQREGDVGGGGDGPALRAGARRAMAKYTSAGTIMPPTAAAIGTTARFGIAQVAGHELPFEFQPGDEEEDRQQPVGGPGGQGQIQMQCGRADLDVAAG